MARIEGITREDAKGCVGAGWYRLLDEVYDVLETRGGGGVVRITTVKEKYGTLNIYAAHQPTADLPENTEMDPNEWNAIGQVLRDVERRSGRICEVCGRAGENSGGSWVKIHCAWHGHLYRICGLQPGSWSLPEGFDDEEMLARARRIESDIAFAEADAEAIRGVTGTEDGNRSARETIDRLVTALESFRLLVRAARGERWAVRTLARTHPRALLIAINRVGTDRRHARRRARESMRYTPAPSPKVHPRVDPAWLGPDDLAPLLAHNDPDLRERAMGLLGEVEQAPARRRTR